MAKINFPRPFGRNQSGKEPDDLGFGTRLTGSNERLINADGSYNIERRGMSGWTPYQSLVEMGWAKIFGTILLFFLIVNGFFATLYLVTGVEHLAGVHGIDLPGKLIDCYFFSVQTFTTVGYGAIHPVSLASHLVASANALVGLMSFALMTGLFFARFAKPRAQFLFSTIALIAPYRDGWSFQFRIANKRNNQIINLKARMIMSWVEGKSNDKSRHYAGMELELDRVSFFPLNWTIVHAIKDGSPLFEKSEREVERMNAEFLVLIEGYDETYAQMVHANRSYTWRELQWKKRFKLMYYPGENGKTVLDLGMIDEVESV